MMRIWISNNIFKITREKKMSSVAADRTLKLPREKSIDPENLT